MIDAIELISHFLLGSFIRWSFLIIIILIIIKLFNKEFKYISYAQTIRWLIIIYATLNCILLLTAFQDDYTITEVFSSRAFGEYWWAYWFMLSMSTLIPLFLLIKRLGTNLLFLLVITIGINIGWLFELVVILISF